jgi:hypothetical protein
LTKEKLITLSSRHSQNQIQISIVKMDPRYYTKTMLHFSVSLPLGIYSIKEITFVYLAFEQRDVSFFFFFSDNTSILYVDLYFIR